MKTISIRVPERIAAEIESESRRRRISKSAVVRERLECPSQPNPLASGLEAIADLIGSVENLPGDLSTNGKVYLRAKSYGRNRCR